jgi:hypothetical protein
LGFSTRALRCGVCALPCSGLEDPKALLALRLEIDVPHLKKHPFRREYDALAAMLPHHGNIIRLWHGFEEPAIVPKVAKALPQFILTRFEDKVSVKPEWVPKVSWALFRARHALLVWLAGCERHVCVSLLWLRALALDNRRRSTAYWTTTKIVCTHFDLDSPSRCR